jgi:hypothetical protein
MQQKYCNQYQNINEITKEEKRDSSASEYRWSTNSRSLSFFHLEQNQTYFLSKKIPVVNYTHCMHHTVKISLTSKLRSFIAKKLKPNIWIHLRNQLHRNTNRLFAMFIVHSIVFICWLCRCMWIVRNSCSF